ncbi:MAG: redoxin domain-containing protein [Acidobacteria bacterium]|nr:redoxin domain-containing protein [Acidobacteriota bacterium]
MLQVAQVELRITRLPTRIAARMTGRLRFQRALVVVFAALAVFNSSASPNDSAEALLQQVHAAYADLTQFRFDATETTITRAGDLERRSESRTVTAAGDVGRFRVESDHPIDGGMIAFDGETTWIYLAKRNQYRRIEGALLDGGDDSPELLRLKNHLVDRYQGITQRLRTARLLPPETLQVDGRGVECRVVEAAYDAPRGLAAEQIIRTYWIASEQPLVYRESSAFEAKNPASGRTTAVTQQIIFHSVQVGGQVSAAAFAPQLPNDARQVADFDGAAGPSAWAGRPAVAFEEKDLTGTIHRSAELDGKVILLDFWATWCVPCRVELPGIESLHREFAAEGLAVFGVNDERSDKARAFVEEHGFSFPTLSDAAGLLFGGYEVRTIPTTVIIGRDGTVSSYLVGAHTIEELRQALSEAGIK